MPSLSNVNRTQPISCVSLPDHDEYIAIRGTSASCNATDGSDDSADAVRPSCSTAARAAAKSLGGTMTNEPAGNSVPSDVNGFSAILTTASRSL